MAADLDGVEITPMDLRARAGEFLDRVRLRHDTFIISRRGEPMAALVPVAKLRLLQELARTHAKAYLAIQERFVEERGLAVEELEREAVEAVRRHRARKRSAR